MLTACTVRSVQIKRAEQWYKKGQYLTSKGEVDKAIVYFEKSIKTARVAGFREGVAHNLNELAIINTAEGEYSKARKQFNEALGIYKELNMEAEISKSLNNIALTYVKEGRFREAIEQFEALMEWDTKSGNELGIGITLYNMALIYNQHLGMKDKSKECFVRAFRIFKESGNEVYIKKIQEKIKKVR